MVLFPVLAQESQGFIELGDRTVHGRVCLANQLGQRLFVEIGRKFKVEVYRRAQLFGKTGLALPSSGKQVFPLAWRNVDRRRCRHRMLKDFKNRLSFPQVQVVSS